MRRSAFAGMFVGGLCISGLLCANWLRPEARPEPSIAGPTTVAAATTRNAPMAEPVGAPGHAPAPARASAPQERTVEVPAEEWTDPEEEVPATLSVRFGARELSWTQDEVREVPRAGGTHDLRELTAHLLHTVDVTVRVVGQTELGERTATVNLAALGATDQLRIWPETDGTWSIARNITSPDGQITSEQYLLEGVTALAFQAN
jgi:hypothetical protein